MPADESTKRSIALDDADWSWATWRPIQAPQKIETRAFDLDDCLERLAAKVKTVRYEWDFSRAGISPGMSTEEARFWLEVMTTYDRKEEPEKKAEQLRKKKLGAITVDAVKNAFKKRTVVPTEIVAALLAHFGPLAPTDMLLTDKPGSDGYNAGGEFFQGWRRWVLPQLSQADREALAKRIRSKVTAANFPTDPYEEPSGEFFVAASIGMHAELLPVVSSWADDRFGKEDWDDAYHVPQLIIFGLGSGTLVSEHIRRLKLRLREEAYMRAWLAHTEYAGLDWASKTIVETKNKDLAASLAGVLALVHAPENAGPMLEIATRSKAPKIGAEWLNQNVGCAAAGLGEIAAGRGALAEAATERLREIKRAGFGNLIGGVAKNVAAALDAKEKDLAPMQKPPPWLSGPLSKAVSLKAPAWIEPSQLPHLDIEDKTLTTDQVGTLLGALAASTLEKPHPLVTLVRERATPPSRDAFVWRIFEAWLTEGAPSKQKWALAAVGLLGADGSALKLAPLVRAWPGESQHQRAVLGLDVLAGIGTDVALMQLSGIAQKVKFQALKRRAGGCMETIAKSRKMSRDELEDRIVPDGGFDEKGERTFDYGPRKFHVVFGSEGAPMIRDDAGARKPDLPKPGAKDDAALASKAVADWKLLKKTLRDVTKIQVVRLEQAMVKGRTWSVKDFDTLVVRHPLMGNLARGIIFGCGKATFRIAEDGTFADEKDAKYTLPKTGTVTIVHPLDMPQSTKDAWGQIFGDYELLPPFAQLGRATFALEPKEKKASDLAARFKGQEWGVSAFVGKLARRGWLHGQPQDAGYVGDHSKPFFSANITAIVEHTGYPIGSREYADPQKIEKLYFVSGVDGRSTKALKLANVDRKALSEVLLDLT